MKNYKQFVSNKRLAVGASGVDPGPVSAMLFDFQADIVRWALRRGKAAIWADCGLGKTPMALEWARQVSAHGPVLILTPLAVSAQFKAEGDKFKIPVNLCRESSDFSDGINVANYERLHKFEGAKIAGIVLDESSILKDYSSVTRNALIDRFASTPYRLACSATPAPNDHMELGNHAEFLGAMTRMEMLAMFFTHDGGETQSWRLKGHARRDFWRWVSSWAVTVRTPEDLGYDGSAFKLPPLVTTEHIVGVGDDFAKERGMLFAVNAGTLSDQRAARRSSLESRVGIAADLCNKSREPWLVWCELNDESAALTAAIDGAVEVKGSDSTDDKESAMRGFTDGTIRVLVTKPSIAGYGMNWQHCANVAFVGISHSFEQWYQAIRRTWRFGQKRLVNCHVIISDADGAVLANLQRKKQDAEKMAEAMVAETSEEIRAQLGATSRTTTTYEPSKRMTTPEWLTEGP